MKKDIPVNLVENIEVVAVYEGGTAESADWQIYFLNKKNIVVENVMVSSTGYGIHEGTEVKTSTLRHFIGDVGANDFARIEPIDSQVFHLTNEYWVSFYADGIMYDKKYRFVPYKLNENQVINIPLLEKKGILAE